MHIACVSIVDIDNGTEERAQRRIIDICVFQQLRGKFKTYLHLEFFLGMVADCASSPLR